MADVVTVYAPASVTVTVIEGAPPVDQSAEVAALTQQVADLQAKIDNAIKAAEAEKAADAAHTAGQDVLDALG